MVIKEFMKRDVFYNNGLVNLNKYLKEHNIDGVYYNLDSEKFVLKFPMDMDKKYYYELFKGFIINNNIIFNTDNYKLYWDRDNSCFVYARKYDIEGAAVNDKKNIYKYITASEIGVSTEKLFIKYLEFAKKNDLKDGSIKNDKKLFKKDGDFKEEKKCNIPVLMTKSEAIENYIEYCVKGNILKLDSKIHQFEDGGYCFRDMLLNKDNLIDKWDALIYWFGVKIKRYYNSVYFIYLNSTNLLTLHELKNHFDISDETEKYRDKKTGKVKSSLTNVKMCSQLEHDGIENNNFYISSSISEFQLKFFMYMLSHIYHIEDDYEKSDRERIRKRVEKLYNNLLKISFVTYTEDGNMKSSLDEYTKAYRVIVFLKRLIETKYDNSTLFKYFADLITSISLSKSDQEKVNLNIKKFCENVLKFSDLRKIYYEVSFKILRNNKRRLGSGLYDFENIYLKEIKRGEYIMSLHTKSKELGREIGVFAANLDDKDLLFKLRSIKNQKQMVSYFKDLKFTVLRKQEDAKFSKGFNNTMEEILTEIEKSSANWEIIRDYMAIYAIDKYRAVVFAKQALKGGK